MTARMIINENGREHIWQCEDDWLMAAIEKVFAEHLAAGETLFIKGPGHPVSGRKWASIEISPVAKLIYTYTEFDGDYLTAALAEVESHVSRFGGLTFDADDNLVEPV
ncbi:MAG: hypothetical protein MSC45_03155 [Mobiluncus sp.]|uniref:hypothetical protein n=1 Tax=Mobiluncus sp. TaxID=47293 RepID=UPI00258AC4C3|nr:hypothetical protein [Mobiluncus sp.]MCI6584055.1 hypothetical protein [Mobiluncus sp.]